MRLLESRLLCTLITLSLFAFSACSEDSGNGNAGGDQNAGGNNYPQCQVNDDCVGDQVCQNGSCVDPQPACENNGDCPGDQVCDNGSCRAFDCNMDGCEGDQVCENDVCVDPPQPCQNDDECDGDQICINQVCDDPVRQACVDNNDCGVGSECQNDVCVVVDPNAQCAVDDDCDDNLVCRAARCVPECANDNDCVGNDRVCDGAVCRDFNCNQDGCEGTDVCEANGACRAFNCNQDDCEGTDVCVADTGVCREFDCNLPEDNCPNGQECQAGQCVEPGPECENDDNCPAGFICQNEMCVEPEPECVADGDCADGQVCQDGSCVADNQEPDINDNTCESYCTHFLDICISQRNNSRSLFNPIGEQLEAGWSPYEQCLGVCAQYEAPADGVDNTIECRMNALRGFVAGGSQPADRNGFCTTASPNGGNSCVTREGNEGVGELGISLCRTYCRVYENNCSEFDLYSNQQECFETCTEDNSGASMNGITLAQAHNGAQSTTHRASIAREINALSCYLNHAYLAGAPQSDSDDLEEGSRSFHCFAASTKYQIQIGGDEFGQVEIVEQDQITGSVVSCDKLFESEPVFTSTVGPIFTHRKCVNCHNFKDSYLVEMDSRNPDGSLRERQHQVDPDDNGCVGCHSNQANEESPPGIMNLDWHAPTGMDIDVIRPVSTCRVAKEQMNLLRQDGESLADAMRRHLTTDAFILWAIDEIGNQNGRVNNIDPEPELAATWAQRVDDWINAGMICR